MEFVNAVLTFGRFLAERVTFSSFLSEQSALYLT